MTDANRYVIDAPEIPAVPVRGGGRFPVRRIYCVGRNYAEHAREMGSDPDREPPFFFSKPADTVVSGGVVPYPPATGELHHEVELVIAIGKAGREIPADTALEYAYGYAVGVDLTRRDLQAAAKKKGRPWDMAKGFDRSAPLSKIVPAALIGHPADGAIRLSVNNDVKQSGDLRQMIWNTAEVIAELSRYVGLAAGDLIFSGTPSGVGPLQPGDTVRASVFGVADLEFVLTG